MNWLEFEKEAVFKGCNLICGVDEAGRGPLAGPVFAAAVILKKDTVIEGLNDSKKLSEKKRELLFEEIKEKALCYSIASASVQEIESLNILKATNLAMFRAVKGLEVTPGLVLVDGNIVPQEIDIPAKAIVKGDSLSASIAAASILAKVSRDRYMLELDKLYPQYMLAKHKGYGTKLHIELIKQHGPSEIHRKSFLKKIAV